jgi:hypothetical protein
LTGLIRETEEMDTKVKWTTVLLTIHTVQADLSYGTIPVTVYSYSCYSEQDLGYQSVPPGIFDHDVVGGDILLLSIWFKQVENVFESLKCIESH